MVFSKLHSVGGDLRKKEMVKLRFEALGRQYVFVMESRKTKKNPVMGYTSKCKNGMNIVIIDVDNTGSFRPEWLDDNLKFLQKNFELGNFIIIESNNGWHCICFSQVNWYELGQIILSSNIADPLHYTVPNMYGSRLLTARFTEKEGIRPKYLRTIKSDCNKRINSLAHIRFLNKIFELNIPEENNDGETEMVMGNYYI